METTKNNKSASVKLSEMPMLLRVANIVHFIRSKFAGVTHKSSNQLVPVPISNAKTNKHSLIISLLNQKKNYDDAALIAEASENWDIDLALLNLSNVDVKGKSVWFNMED